MARLPWARPQGPLVGRPQVAVPELPATDLRPSQPAQLGSDLGTPVRLPGADFPPAGAVALDAVGDANLAPAATGTLITERVPDNLRLRIAGIGFGADDEVALRFLTWAILLDGDPAPSGYSAQPAAIGSLRQLSEVFLLASSSVTVTIFVTIATTAALTYRYICRLRGWFYVEKGNG